LMHLLFKNRRAFYALRKFLKEIEEGVKAKVPKALPDSDKPINILPGSKCLVEVQPKKGDFYTGPFFPLLMTEESRALGTVDAQLKEWLLESSRADAPVVYISLGTLVSPSAELLANRYCLGRRAMASSLGTTQGASAIVAKLSIGRITMEYRGLCAPACTASEWLRELFPFAHRGQQHSRKPHAWGAHGVHAFLR